MIEETVEREMLKEIAKLFDDKANVNELKDFLNKKR